MYIRCWGSRGSIPVDGEQYRKYGGTTTCMEIRSGRDVCVVDAGTGIRELGNSLIKNGDHNIHLFFTHVHWDHVQGFPFFKPIFRKQTNLNIYGNSFSEVPFQEVIAKTMEAPYFPINIDGIGTNLSYENPFNKIIKFGNLAVHSIPLSHPNKGLGYKFVENDKQFVFLTDNELTFRHPGSVEYDDYVNFARNADLLIHDAEYLEDEYAVRKAWGHTCFIETLELAIRAAVKRFGLFHINQERTDDQVDAMVEKCRKILKERSVKMECFAVAAGYEINL